MDPELKARWVAALRSGDYRQGLRNLRHPFGSHGGYFYCCLGVLCDLYDPSRWERQGLYRYAEEPVGFDLSEKYGSASVLPQLLAEELGVSMNGEIILPDGLKTRVGKDGTRRDRVLLSGLNDEGFTFDQIADMIDYFL